MGKSRYSPTCSGPARLSTAETSESMRGSAYLRIRPFLDRAAAMLLLVLSSPILLVAMLAVRWTSRGPTIYSQIRVGRDGRLFRIYKIRSMYHGCESRSGIRWSQPGDPRVTRLGRYLRATHIDELPQLINILRGEMSLIGPRPERPAIVERLEQALPRYRERLGVLPGLTGLAQILLPPDSDLGGVAAKLICDLHYVQHMDFFLDLGILLNTPLHVLGVPSPTLNRWFGIPAIKNLECDGPPVAGNSGSSRVFPLPFSGLAENLRDSMRPEAPCRPLPSGPESS